jgi:hypothetical protein
MLDTQVTDPLITAAPTERRTGVGGISLRHRRHEEHLMLSRRVDAGSGEHIRSAPCLGNRAILA